jgi:hypothetical protein
MVLPVWRLLTRQHLHEGLDLGTASEAKEECQGPNKGAMNKVPRMDKTRTKHAKWRVKKVQAVPQGPPAEGRERIFARH